MMASDELGVTVALCAVHPEVTAILTCPICGSYACAKCAVVTPWGESLCAACLAAGRAVSPMDREEGRNVVHAVWLSLTSPRKFFGNFSSEARPFGRPLFVAASTSVVAGSLFTLISAYSHKHSELSLSVLLGPALAAVELALVMGPAAGACVALLVPLASRGLPLRSGVRAGLYLSCAWLLAAPFLILRALSVAALGPSYSALSGATLAIPVLHQLSSLYWLARRGGRRWPAAVAIAPLSLVLGLAAASLVQFLLGALRGIVDVLVH